MNKIYSENTSELQKEKTNNIVISIILYALGIIITTICLILQTRENLVLTTIISIVVSVVTFSFASYLLLFENNKISSYLKIQNTKNTHNKKLKVYKILNDEVFINYLLFKIIIFVDENNNEIELRILSSKINEFVVDAFYKLEIANDVVIGYEK